MKLLFTLALFVCLNVHAQSDAPTEQPATGDHRSLASHRFLLAGALGLQVSPLSMLSSEYEAGSNWDLELRVRLFEGGGILLNWHRDHVSLATRHQTLRLENSFLRLGGYYRIFALNRNRFWRGSHLDAHAGLQRGTSVHHTFNNSSREQGAGRENGFGAKLGVDFYFPGYFGSWIFAGGGIEANSFNYDLPPDSGGDGQPKPKSNYVFARLGLAVSF